MAYVTVIVMLALMEYLYFGVAVSRARTRHGVNAPAISGDEDFELFHRAHQNTLEQLIVFIPAIYAAAYYANEVFAALVGIVFLVGRADYFRSYISDPNRRGRGMIATMAASVVLIAAALIGAVRVALVT
jgi:glutathione S-transferase